MSIAESRSEYATWAHPETGQSVQYSIPVLQEIEFLVNDGYRRIPHGGVETGGLLFGTADEATVRIDGFKPIECEHAFGPSFQLSERDLERLGRQIADSVRDDSLESSIPVGWFIAHTRSELVLSERELQLFLKFFRSRE